MRKWWEAHYKGQTSSGERARSKTPDPKKKSFLESLVNRVAPDSSLPSSRSRTSVRKDQLQQYLDEPLNSTLGLMEYWNSKSMAWPELTRMAFDLMAIPAMSSECERVFSLCAKMTTADSGSLSGKTLWHHQCLKNWSKHGVIDLALYKNAVKVEHGFGE